MMRILMCIYVEYKSSRSVDGSVGLERVTKMSMAQHAAASKK